MLGTPTASGKRVTPGLQVGLRLRAILLREGTPRSTPLPAPPTIRPAATCGAAPLALVPPVEFILFALVLAGVALFHTQAMRIALGGALAIALYKVLWSPFRAGAGVPGLALHLQHETVILVNLLLLLLGFALLADLWNWRSRKRHNARH